MARVEMTDPHIHGLLCDLDGVVRLWPAHLVATAERTAGLPGGSILQTAFAADLLPLAITGRISDEAWRQEVSTRLQHAWPEADASLAVAEWSSSPGEVNQPVMALLQRHRVPVALITNATTRLPQDLSALGLTGAFEQVINSSVIGVAKPDQGIFAAALRALALPADQVLFIDDDPGHIAAAARLGMAGYLFHGNAQELEDLLRESGVVR